MRAAIIEKPGRVVVREVPDPLPLPNEVIVEGALAGLCGTDVHLYTGERNYGYSLIPGHGVVGTVVEVGEEVSGLSRTQRRGRVLQSERWLSDWRW